MKRLEGITAYAAHLTMHRSPLVGVVKDHADEETRRRDVSEGPKPPTRHHRVASHAHRAMVLKSTILETCWNLFELFRKYVERNFNIKDTEQLSSRNHWQCFHTTFTLLPKIAPKQQATTTAAAAAATSVATTTHSKRQHHRTAVCATLSAWG